MDDSQKEKQQKTKQKDDKQYRDTSDMMIYFTQDIKNTIDIHKQ